MRLRTGFVGYEINPDPTIEEILDVECSYDVSGALFSDKVQRGVWDGRKHLYSRVTTVFPYGLLISVCNVFKNNGIEYTINESTRAW